MRKDTASFIFGLGLNIIFGILQIMVASMPMIVAILGYIVGAVLMILGIIGFFGKRKHKESTLPVSNSKFDIVWLSEEFWLKDSHGSYYSYNSTDEQGKTSLVVKAMIAVNTLRLISVQSIALEVGSQLIPWGEDDTNVFGEPTKDEYEFEFPLNTPRGKQLAKIKAIVDGQEYISPKPFIIDLPRKVN